MSRAARGLAPRRREQIATSTPSRASMRAIPLPIPALPPVTSAVLLLSCRSMGGRQTLAWLNVFDDFVVADAGVGFDECRNRPSPHNLVLNGPPRKRPKSTPWRTPRQDRDIRLAVQPAPA